MHVESNVHVSGVQFFSLERVSTKKCCVDATEIPKSASFSELNNKHIGNVHFHIASFSTQLRVPDSSQSFLSQLELS